MIRSRLVSININFPTQLNIQKHAHEQEYNSYFISYPHISTTLCFFVFPAGLASRSLSNLKQYHP